MQAQAKDGLQSVFPVTHLKASPEYRVSRISLDKSILIW
jgi:hypothetical protein